MSDTMPAATQTLGGRGSTAIPVQRTPYIQTELIPVGLRDVGGWWPHVTPWVQQAIDRGGRLETVEAFRKSIAESKAQLWLVCCPHALGVIITEIFDAPRGRTCGVPIAFGEDLEGHLIPVLQKIESWARAEGCVRLEGFGRAGWIRVLHPFGWRPLATIIEKELSHGV